MGPEIDPGDSQDSGEHRRVRNAVRLETRRFWSKEAESLRRTCNVAIDAAPRSVGGRGRLGRCPAHCIQYQPHHLVWVAVGVGPSVLDVPLLVAVHLPRDSDGRASVRHSIPEFFV